MTLRPEDFIAAIRYMLQLRTGDPGVDIDDIDHLGNRRLRTIDELASDELRKGFLKLRRTVQERMSLKDVEDMTPRSLINPKSISAAIEYFFGRGELSQVVDQTNPLSMLTHERRLSALGPGGLNRKRAGFEVRDVHISHYGRICPIETPEGTNIGLISSLAIYSAVDEYGFLVTPYRKVNNGKLTDDVVWLRADEESEAYLAPADTPVENGKLKGDTIIARYHADFELVPIDKIQYIDVSPEPDGRRLGRFDSVPGARRRQPRADGFQHAAASRAAVGHRAADRGHRAWSATWPQNSGMIVRARRKGTVTYVDANADRNRRRSLSAAQVRRPQRADLPEPEADRRRSARRSKRARSSPTAPPRTRASWPWAATCSSASWPGTATTSRTRSSSAKSW